MERIHTSRGILEKRPRCRLDLGDLCVQAAVQKNLPGQALASAVALLLLKQRPFTPVLHYHNICLREVRSCSYEVSLTAGF